MTRYKWYIRQFTPTCSKKEKHSNYTYTEYPINTYFPSVMQCIITRGERLFKIGGLRQNNQMQAKRGEDTS